MAIEDVKRQVERAIKALKINVASCNRTMLFNSEHGLDVSDLPILEVELNSRISVLEWVLELLEENNG